MRYLSDEKYQETLKEFLRFAVEQIKEEDYDAEAEKLKTLKESGINRKQYEGWIKLAKDLYQKEKKEET